MICRANLHDIKCFCGEIYTFDTTDVPYGERYETRCPKCNAVKHFMQRPNPLTDKTGTPITLRDDDVKRIIEDGSLLQFINKYCPNGAYLSKEVEDLDTPSYHDYNTITVSKKIEISNEIITNADELINFQKWADYRQVILGKYVEK